MSRVSYQFVTNTSTSWTHEIQCDGCKLKVVRIGELPTSEKGPIPKFESDALAGWASFEMRSTRPGPDQSPDTEQDLWPRLDRDFCPGCAKMVNDWLASWGADIGKHEERYLDALGRPTQRASPTTFGPGVEMCWVQAWGDNTQHQHCRRTRGHEGDHSAEHDRDGLECPVCSTHAGMRQFVFTHQELESHAVDQHSVRYSDGSAEPIGWYTRHGWHHTYYPDVVTALHAERQQLEAGQDNGLADLRAAAPWTGDPRE